MISCPRRAAISINRMVVTVRAFSNGGSINAKVSFFFVAMSISSVPDDLAAVLQMIDHHVESGLLHGRGKARRVDPALAERELVRQDLHTGLGNLFQRLGAGALPGGEPPVLHQEQGDRVPVVRQRRRQRVVVLHVVRLERIARFDEQVLRHDTSVEPPRSPAMVQRQLRSPRVDSVSPFCRTMIRPAKAEPSASRKSVRANVTVFTRPFWNSLDPLSASVPALA